MSFKKYMHIERWGTDEVQGIELGKIYVFPKLDGTNGSLWYEDEIIKAGSRNRQLSLQSDNQGFYNHILLENKNKFYKFFRKHPNYRLFGEWLVSHSLKTYKDDAWKKFYIFDITIQTKKGLEYIPYYNYQSLLEEFKLDYIPCISVIKNGSYDTFIKELAKNVFLIKDGKGVGEGIVLKNYDYYNKYGRQIWAKIITNEFKEKHFRQMGPTKLNGSIMIEEKIVEKFCTEAFIEKTYNKILDDIESWDSKCIIRLLESVYYELINEESWHIIKKFKNPTINYRTLKNFVINRVKTVKKELF